MTLAVKIRNYLGEEMTGIRWIIGIAMVIGVLMGSVLAVLSADKDNSTEQKVEQAVSSDNKAPAEIEDAPLAIEKATAGNAADTTPKDKLDEHNKTVIVDSSDKAEIESIIYNYLVENPHVIVKSLENYQREQERLDQIAAQQALQDNFDTLANAPYSFSVGDKDAKVTIIEFFDYNCGYCRVATPTLLKVAEKNPDVRVVFKEYPIRGEDSFKVARATLAAIEQGKYLELHRSLMKISGKITISQFEKVAKRHKVNMTKIRAGMDKEDIQESLKVTYDLAKALMIEGTPSFIIGDEIVRGWPGPENFEAMVADQIKKSSEKG
jgi:protein-disulfide isomerase